MAENLNYNAEGSVCYDNKPRNCERFGRLYNWETAMKACPEEWSLPSEKDFDKLVESVESDGYFFDNAGKNGNWWSATNEVNFAWSLNMTSSENSLYKYKLPKDRQISVRCLQN